MDAMVLFNGKPADANRDVLSREEEAQVQTPGGITGSKASGVTRIEPSRAHVEMIVYQQLRFNRAHILT